MTRVTDGSLGDDPAALTAAVLTEEAKRQDEQAARSAVTILPDDLLPGVGEAQMPLGDALRIGGRAMVLMLALITVAENLERAAGGVVAPDIQDTLNMSDTTLIAVSAFGGVALVLGAVPLAWLADRVSRVRIVWIATLGWGVATAINGLVVNPFQLFCSRVGIGFGQAYSVPVFASLLTDTYPIQSRSRIYALYWMSQPIGLLLGPFVAGSIAEAAGGPEGWRWTYLILATVPFVLGLISLAVLREPGRGQYEQELVLGATLSPVVEHKQLPVSMSTAYARMKKIKTFYYICTGIGVLGFALVAVPIQLGLLLDDSYGYDAYTRGWMLSLTAIASLVAIPIAGVTYDRLFRRNPEFVVRLAGSFVVAYGILLFIATRMQPIGLLLLFVALASACTSAAFVSVGSIVGAVAPYRMRTQAFALIPVFIFLMGGFFGGILAGALSDAHGERTALAIIGPIAGSIGGFLFIYGSRFLKRDISLAVEELLEEQAEIGRMSEHPDDIPVLQIHNLDYSYGPVQVLFDVSLDVRKGEVIALLGTNGAGKSTLLRAINGLGIPDRGVVRLNGRTLTYVDAEIRFREGIVQLRGGEGVFPELTVSENLQAAFFSTKLSREERQARIAKQYATFPALGERRSQHARDLSGGQQQMLALAMTLVQEPEILLIDELSLGLAPVVVEELLGVVQRLKDTGQTMIVVEQSLNIALAFADRAVFMEKGRVRFEGPAQELAERGDLVRAVFLGGEGGERVFGIEITQQAIFYGVIFGLIYAVFAAGFVLVYRATGVLNFAQGEIGAFGVAIFSLFHVQYHVPYWLAFVFAVALTGLIGMVIELSVIRRLFNSPRLVVLIATVGVAQLLLFLRISLPRIEGGGGFPLPFTGQWEPTSSFVVLPREILVLLIAPAAIVILGLFMTKTSFGLAVRASASNADTARVFGISVKRTSTTVWTIAALFAAVTGILVAPLLSVTPGNIVAAATVAIGPSLLLRALVVALIARMYSLPMTIVGGIAVGVFERIVLANVDRRDQSIVDLYLFIAALILVMFVVRNRRDDTGWSLSAQVKPIPERLRALWYVRRLPQLGFGILFGFLAVLPVFLTQRSQEFLWTEILIYALIAMSITPLSGWAGQLSLGQFAFVGIGALSMVVLRSGHDIPVPLNLWDMSFELGWLPAVAFSVAIGTLAAVIIGIPALRVRGLFLAVITLAFAVMCSNWLFRESVFTGSRFGTNTPRIDPPVIAGIDFANRRDLYYLCLIVLILTTMVTARLRRTGIGRSMIAVRDNEDMAAASTVAASRIKVMSFGISGGIAALGGCLLITLREQVTPTQAFGPEESLRVVATAVIGGLGSIAGPIIGALWVRGLPVLFSDTAEVRLFTSSIGLLILLMYFPGGLIQIMYKIRDAVLEWADLRLAAREVERPVPAIEKRVPTRTTPREVVVADGAPWLATNNVCVRFGGIQAVSDVSLTVGRDELVGLIGTNGAGKSTLMNAISGFVRSTGEISVLGRDISGLPAYRRHRRGLGRGFQSARLYPALTVRETIMVALEARERSWLLPSMTALPPSPGAERRKRSEAAELIDFLGLGRYADEFVSNLSTGTRRIVELGTLLAVDARVLLLDEPTGGVAQREAEAFGPLIVRIRRELGASMLLIEHDMPLIMSISDRVYCLEAGAVIAEGTPAEVRANPLVIASYLGTDERAIQRSGAAGVP